MMASVVMVCFVAAVEFQHYDWVAVPWLYIRDLVLLIQHIINLVAITYIPHTIKIQVIYVGHVGCGGPCATFILN